MTEKIQNKDKRNIKKAAVADYGTGKEQMKTKKFVKSRKISQWKIATSTGQLKGDAWKNQNDITVRMTMTI